MRETKFTSICLLAAFWALPAVADDCSDLEAQEAKVAAAKNCGEAHKLYEACLWGSTADLQRGSVVTETCEKAFLSTLSAAQQKSYSRKKDACAKKYRNESGTMYRSMEAVCIADAAYDYWKKYGTK
ncbi:hypothetical protein OGR47_02180 [Methylocystis sp. MJC1]|jgi:hypothetical protein|uniref:hypothetical protein n=1 Tax=Methylocystis sp. MJC1 TaxID=2654282 RepID=UPI0013EDE74D|nr:hypothetical protein [Methylocystis sp. MJC1]KAF2990516.1 hypothetical protein MJC1_02278 [Methylocystis sp. MJC1]MBU6525821.1 hypothetical protein [Methylocystis sp. MJC1]UZX12288.1 hypothetical protein OGR47_02180 [Methylocystis sp. MJC1]